VDEKEEKTSLMSGYPSVVVEVCIRHSKYKIQNTLFAQVKTIGFDLFVY